MPANNRSAHPFYIIAGTMVCLLALSVFSKRISLNGFNIRKVDMLADIRRTVPVPAPPTPAMSLAKAAPPQDQATAVDSPTLRRRRTYDYMTYTGIQEYEDSTGVSKGLLHFLTALEDLRARKRKKVRVAYFGDSIIEADLITGDLRDSLQANFGGAGVGFVQITSVVATWRTSIRHTFSDNWTDYHFKNKPPENTLLGICGHAFVPAPESWAKYSPVQKPGLNRFNEVGLLYGPAAGTSLLINDKPYTLNGTAAVNELLLPPGDVQNSVTLKYQGSATPPALYGLSFESDSGVYVDNYSFRGITGLELALLNGRMIRQMQQAHAYDLVVIHYGANVLFRPELTDYNWYEQSMQKVMDSFGQNWPNTSFLIIGTADKGYKKDDHFVTAPGVRPLLKAQHELAEDNGTAYWNLFAAMGGEGSMARWVQEDPAYGKKDHTHFTTYGARRVGALLYKAIMDEFRQEVHP
jgi:lysophospholipase L1-like esterase